MRVTDPPAPRIGYGQRCAKKTYISRKSRPPQPQMYSEGPDRVPVPAPRRLAPRAPARDHEYSRDHHRAAVRLGRLMMHGRPALTGQTTRVRRPACSPPGRIATSGLHGSAEHSMVPEFDQHIALAACCGCPTATGDSAHRMGGAGHGRRPGPRRGVTELGAPMVLM
jgi:hypothetical protein